jgi:molecular chaperone GrpE
METIKDKHKENESMEGSMDHTERPGKKAKKEHKKDQVPNAFEEQVMELNKKVEELNDKYLRLYSEFDNYRKRTLKEKSEMSKTASEEVILSMLPVLDDFERAINAFGNTEDKSQSSFSDGVVLIYNKFKNILHQKGLKAIKSIGEPFDVDYHDALTTVPAPAEDLKGKVVDEIEKGYVLSDKVIRHAKVVVGN